MATISRFLEQAMRLTLLGLLGAAPGCAHGSASTATASTRASGSTDPLNAAEEPRGYIPPRISADAIEARIVDLRERLSLDAAQEAQVRSIFADSCARYERLRRQAEAQGGVEDPALRAQFVQLDFGTEDRIVEVLRCDQKDLFRVLLRDARMERVEYFHAMRRREGETTRPPLLPSP